MSGKWTPGPWTFDNNWLDGPDGLPILVYTTNDDGLHGALGDKNLIAAAPDLLEALEQLLMADEKPPTDENLTRAVDAMQRARIAIAKARGEA